MRRGELHGKKVLLGRSAADYECDMIWRAGCCSESLHLLQEERNQCGRVEDSLGHLVQICLVCRAAALYHAEELVFHALFCLDIDLRRKIALGIDLFVHCQRCILAVTEILLGICLEHSL